MESPELNVSIYNMERNELAIAGMKEAVSCVLNEVLFALQFAYLYILKYAVV